ncbi:hypothetical protein MIN45_P2139 [Methylomarinovum tepidoasis]|uniref:Uncharacterized protein n=2 Tax=Methylomarinovum tepidoasis TaxID=2840183 RepID=A0AAU9CK05_9GAMM|nr:hypothetical protein MIN45_P2139 [Methylomarinovum sp. IN45]
MEISIPAQDGAWQMVITDSQGRELATLNGGEDARRYVLALSASGAYFVKIQASSSVSYRFSIGGDQLSPPGGSLFDQLMLTAIREVEPNDSFREARTLIPGSPVLGDFASTEDQGWFIFSTTTDAIIIPTLELELPAQAGRWRLSLLDQEGNLVAQWDSDPNRDQNFRLPLNKGTDYYLRAEPLESSSQPYLFQAGGDGILPWQSPSRYNQLIQSAAVEVEPNDHRLAAVPIEAGAVTGQLSSASDQDWYQLRTTAADVLVNLEVPAAPGGGVWQLTLMDAGGNVLSSWQTPTEGVLRASARLAWADTYYLSVTAAGDGASQEAYVFSLTGESLGDPGIRNPLANFHDVEVEPNDTPDQANPLAAAAAIRGQLLYDDVDWFRFEVAEPGYEIAFLELCPPGSPCTLDAGSSWVALVFDGAKLTPEMLGQPGVCMDGDSPMPSQYLYAQADSGVFGEALIASIDPSFGGNNQLELGFHQPGTYYVAILTRSERTEDGKVKCTQLFSDDMYQFNFTLRGLAPLTEDNALIATLQGEELSVPVVQVGEQLYSARLQRVSDQDGQMRFELIKAVPLENALERLDYEPLTGRRTWTTLEGDIAHIPLVEFNGRYYAADLQISQEGGKTVLRVLRANRLD